MSWLVFVVLILFVGFAGMRRAQRAGNWSWSKFALTLGFMAVVCGIITAPVVMMDMNNRYFWPVYGFAWAVALGLMIGYIIWARSWKIPANKDNQQPPR